MPLPTFAKGICPVCGKGLIMSFEVDEQGNLTRWMFCLTTDWSIELEEYKRIWKKVTRHGAYKMENAKQELEEKGKGGKK